MCQSWGPGGWNILGTRKSALLECKRQTCPACCPRHETQILKTGVFCFVLFFVFTIFGSLISSAAVSVRVVSVWPRDATGLHTAGLKRPEERLPGEWGSFCRDSGLSRGVKGGECFSYRICGQLPPVRAPPVPVGPCPG